MVNQQKKPTKLLPVYLQTETTKKVFEATADHLFQPSDVSFLNGYIGTKPPWYNKIKDLYIEEPTKSRADYQLTPTAVSVNYLDGSITNAMFYEDLLGQLRFQGANISNQSRLFESEYYSWAPPIDVDKFVNFGNYYWLPNGPDSIKLLNTTDFINDLGIPNYTYVGSWILTSTGELFTGELKFVNGLKITPTADKTLAYNNVDFYIEGVGQKIKLVHVDLNRSPAWDIYGWDVYGWDGDDTLLEKKYITIGRGAPDGNQWSYNNRWFNRNVVEISKTYISDTYKVQAFRPILEFDAGIELWKYGTYDRGIVDVLDNSNGDVMGSMVGQSAWTIQGIQIQDGMKILVTADVHPNTNNRIYVVSGLSDGSLQLTLLANGQNPTGAPAVGDRVSVRFGSDALEGKNTYFDGVIWNLSGQQKFGLTPPLFMLYDVDGNALNDPSIYDQSTFAGSKVFSYEVSETALMDDEIGQQINLDQFGDYIFDNNVVTDSIKYVSDGSVTEYVGDKFCKINGFSGLEYTNSWFKSQTPSRQYIIDRYTITSSTTQFIIDQVPAPRIENTLPSIFVTVIDSNQTETLLIEGKDYTVTDTIVTLTNPVADGDVVIIESWGRNPPARIAGYYEVPKNLSANPNNQQITSVSRSQILPQFVEIIENQYGFDGKGIGNNNYGNTARNRSLGLTILQHRAPLLKLAAMNSTAMTDITSTQSMTDPMLAMEWAERSYVRFYNRFLQSLFTMNSNVVLTGSASPQDWVNAALTQINVGKTTASPWANSGPTTLPGAYCSVEQTTPTYVPATPTRLGITPAYQPYVFFDTSYTTPRLTIQTHDGGLMVMVDTQGEQLGTILHDQQSTTNPNQLTNPVAAAWLQFELNLFNSLPANYRNVDIMPVYDIRTEMPGKWRNTDYTQTEVLDLFRAPFDKWVINNQIDYTANTGYETGNQFSYNYHNVPDKDGKPVPGHWQGIYRWFYDTDRPHLAPWEMLGFSMMPDWWTSEYGPAPYTNGNTALWADLRDGYVRTGPRQGYHPAWARPGLMSCIPVDDQGNLLPPFLAGCVSNLPSVSDSTAPWQFGDGSPIETVWINSLDYNFVFAQIGYLMKPAKFVEYTWDTLRTKEIYTDQNNSQWIYIDTNSRRSSQQFYVHRERPLLINTGTFVPHESTLAYFGSCGSQHWISEYVINQGYDVTNYFGNIIRGCNVQLAHRMAGYIAADSLRCVVDSFGEVGYNSRVVPSENVHSYLYRSTSIGESVYSGVIVEQIAGGWRVSGYNSVTPVFNIIPSDINGPKTTVVIGNQRVYEYSTGLNTVEQVQYDTSFATRQQVYDFLISYGRWLTSQGWVFDQYSADANSPLDWSLSGKEFLFWSQGVWDNGTFVTLSPAAESIKYSQLFGNIQYVNGNISGTYPILDRGMQPIQPQNLTVIRNENDVIVRPLNNQGVFSLRLFRTTLENAIFFDNTTSFNDIIYDPLFDLQQERILIYTYKTNGWNGRVNAPGYFLLKNQTSNTWSMTSNFEKTASDISKYFNIEQPTNYNPINPNNKLVTQDVTVLGTADNAAISNLARHLVGYQNRVYLQNLLLEDSVEFQFYQGFIRQKGTQSTLSRLLRNTSIIPADSTFEYYEEWLFRTSYYGANDLNDVIEFILPQNKVLNDPQLIRLFSNQDADIPYDNVLDIVPKDPLIITPPESYRDNLFELNPSYGINPVTDLPTAGYPLLGETTWFVSNQTELLDLYTNKVDTVTPLGLHDTVWQFIAPNQEWTAYRLSLALGQVDTTVPSQLTGQPTTILTTVPHGLIEGDICIIKGVAGVPGIDGTYEIFNVGPQSFQIQLSTFTDGTGGTIWVYSRIRFADLFDRDSNTPPDGWVDGDLAYVDNGGIVANAWTVYKQAQGKWTAFRQQNLTVAASLITSSQLYNSITGQKIANVDYFDPAKGRISGLADAEINFKTDYDPAKYTNGNSTGYAISPTEAWSSAQLGLVWWDLSTVRYIDYEQNTETYRIQNWGKVAPGTSIDVYEWIRSTIPPTDWANYVAEGKSITTNRGSFIPSGSVLNPSNPNWTQVVETDVTGIPTTYYYFWVKNSDMSPPVPWRTLTTLVIASLIDDPSVSGNPWYAAISPRSIILGNATTLLNGHQVFQRINYSKLPNNENVYSDWDLMRPDDPYSQPSDLQWSKLQNSLVTFDGLGNDVPDYQLTDLQKYGTLIRPRQTWFEDRIAASKLFVDTFNLLISKSVTPLVDDSSKIEWSTYFNAEEPQPTTGWQYHVEDLSQRDALIGVIVPGQVVLVDAVSATNNLWTMWQYSNTNEIWTLVRIQTYKTPKYWEYVDWYLDPYNANTQPSITVNSVSNLNEITGQKTGTIVKVLDNGTNKWQLYVWDSQDWKLIAQQDGSIFVLPTIYTWSADFGGFDGQLFDSGPFDQFAGIEFANIIEGIKNAIYSESNSLELNVLFFTMIKYVMAEQQSVDWAIKTSNIVLKGFNQPLEQYQLLPEDSTDSILGFMNEAKPYHAKIRSLITGKTKLDLANVSVVDFDCPPGWNTQVPPDDGSLEWKILNSTFQSWLANYQTNPELIRTLKTKLIFDRIATPAQVIGWGTVWSTLGWSDESNEVTYGAIDRIEAFYSPTAGMLPKIIAQLMIGVDYRGLTLNSLNFNIEPGWDVAPWDSLIGWQPDRYTIEQYIDQIIQGGQIPLYDTYIGNGVTTQFNLLQSPTSPLQMIVWADGDIKKYGVDWTVPTFANTVTIVSGGIGYHVGDRLEISGGLRSIPVIVQVESVTGTGSITSLSIVSAGSYTTVVDNPCDLIYVSSSFPYGSGATATVSWDCESIVFNTAPANSDHANVYILYAGTTFGAAPDGDADTIYTGGEFVMPHVTENHPEEYYPHKLVESIMIDTYTSSVGGRPLVATRVYQTDGIQTEFDITIKPENNDSLMVYLDGVLLTPGVGNDYVVNYITNRVVFITPPAPGMLRISATSAGGGSRIIHDVYVADTGSGYLPGDQIILAGGASYPATIQLTTVKPTSATVVYPGTGYQVNDALVIDGGTLASVNDVQGGFKIDTVVAVSATPDNPGSDYLVGDTLTISNTGFVTPVVLQVAAVGTGGEISALTVLQAGVINVPNAPTASIGPTSQTSAQGVGATVNINWGVGTVSLILSGAYSSVPTNPATVSGTGTGATLNISYGAQDAIILNPGLYTRVPTGRSTQAAGSVTAGTGATWALVFTKRLNEYIFIGDGTTIDFPIPGIVAGIPEGLMVSINGILTDISRIDDGIRILPAPAAGDTIVVNSFSTQQYSVIKETSITVSNTAVLSYQLESGPYHTLPYYVSMLVRKNGKLIDLPGLQEIFGDGTTISWPITIDITTGVVLSTDVYMDSFLLVNGVDYVISGNVITFTQIPAAGADITIACIKDTTPYTITATDDFQYFINFIPGYLTNGDNILVTTYSEDVSYGFQTEEFVGHDPGWDLTPWDIYGWDITDNRSFILAGIPWDLMSLTVWLNDTLQTPMYDYVVNEVVDFETNEVQYVEVLFGTSLLPTDRITINYLMGLPERPAIAWRTLIHKGGVNSIAIDDNQKTIILSNVLTTSTTIEIADYTKVTVPVGPVPQYIYINDELIGYSEIIQAPTVEYPNRAFLSRLIRNARGTSGDPRAIYTTLFYDGDNERVYFPTEAVNTVVSETVWVDDVLQIPNVDYTIVLNPPALPAGRYALMASAPNAGFKNVKIVSMNRDDIGATISHVQLSTVVNAGDRTTIPGGYIWQPAQYGLQYNKTFMAEFLLEHSGTRS